MGVHFVEASSLVLELILVRLNLCGMYVVDHVLYIINASIFD